MDSKTYCSDSGGIAIVSVRQASWRVPAGVTPAQVGSRLVAS
jgi:hypothetical protein